MIRLTDEWHKGRMAQAVPGSYWHPGEKAWVLEDPTPRAAAAACKLFPQLQTQHPELVAMRDELTADVRPFDNATPWFEAQPAAATARLAPNVERVLDGMGWSLHPYQRIDLTYGREVLRQHGALYIGWERGLGKTLASCVLADATGAQTMLVVCPNTAKQPVWAAELARFLPDWDVIIMGNSEKERSRALTAVQNSDGLGLKPILVTHYEALAVVAGVRYKPRGRSSNKTISKQEWSALPAKQKKNYSKIIGEGWKQLPRWDLAVVDEAHRLSNPDTLMTRAFNKVPRRHTVLLSGSIIQNHLEEMYSPLHIMFPDRYKARWRDWNDRYLDYVESGYGKVCVGVKPERVEALRAELGVFMVYRRKQDELDLPTRTDQSLLVDLSPAQRKAYRQLADECLTVLADGTKLKAGVGAAMMQRLRQVASGLDLVSDTLKDSTKIDLAVEMITDGVAADDDFVVFGWYKSSVYALRDRLKAKGIEAFVVTGDQKHAERDELIASFNAGEARVLIGTLATMGESVNLQRANNVIMLDRAWNPALNAQAEDRVYRQGQRRETTITHIIARDTVDELNVLPTLANKEALRAAILGGA